MEPEEAVERMRRAVAIGGYMDAEETEDCTRAALALIDRIYLSGEETARVVAERDRYRQALEHAEELLLASPDIEDQDNDSTENVVYAIVSAALNQGEATG
jgi:hypothetical protein